MKKNLDEALTTIDGSRSLKLEPGSEAAATYGAIATNALLTGLPGESPTGLEKAKRYELALRLHKGGEQDLTADEVVLIKDRVGVVYDPLVVGQVYRWADQ